MKTQETIRNMKRNFIYILTGLLFSGLLGLVSMSLATGDTWTKKADMPTPRYGLSAAAVNGKIYVIGGATGDPPVDRSTVEEYDPTTDTWTRKSEKYNSKGTFLSADSSYINKEIIMRMIV